MRSSDNICIFSKYSFPNFIQKEMFSLINDRINSWWFYQIGTDWNSSESRSTIDDLYIIWVAIDRYYQNLFTLFQIY